MRRHPLGHDFAGHQRRALCEGIDQQQPVMLVRLPVAALGRGEFEAAEKALIDSRSEAGIDPELRFRAAYNLGEAYAAHADQVRSGKDADLAKALTDDETGRLVESISQE